jgi:hypothetical protein
MRAAIPPLSNTPSRRGAQLRRSTGITLPLPLHLILHYLKSFQVLVPFALPLGVHHVMTEHNTDKTHPSAGFCKWNRISQQNLTYEVLKGCKCHTLGILCHCLGLDSVTMVTASWDWVTSRNGFVLLLHIFQISRSHPMPIHHVIKNIICRRYQVH